jgi:hypothetical protein
MLTPAKRKTGKKKHMVASPRLQQRRVLRTIDESKRNYEIILHNSRSSNCSTTLNIVRGIDAARASCDLYNKKLTQAERDNGWSCFPNATTKRPWSKPRRHSINPGGKSEGYGKR